MKKFWKTFLATFSLAAAAPFAQGATWSGDAIPQSLELVPMVDNSGAEASLLFVVYHSGQIYGTLYSDEKGKGWFDLVKSAIQSGKRVSILWDQDYAINTQICGNYDYTGNCIGTNAGPIRRILRISFKP